MSGCPRRNIWGSFGLPKTSTQFQRTRVRSIASWVFFLVYQKIWQKYLKWDKDEPLRRLHGLRVLLKLWPTLAVWNHYDHTVKNHLTRRGSDATTETVPQGPTDDSMSDTVWFIRCRFVVFLLFRSNKGGSDCKKSTASTGRPPSYQAALVAYYHAGTKKRCWRRPRTVSPFISHKLSLYSKCQALFVYVCNLMVT